MRNFLFTLLLLATANSVFSANYYTTQDGLFTSNIWNTTSHAGPGNTTPDGTCNISISATTVLYISHNVTINCNVTLVGGCQLIIENGGVLTIDGGADLSGNGKITVDAGGTLNITGDLNVGGTGDMTINGTVNIDGSFINGNNTGNVICGSGNLNVGSGLPPTGWDSDACNLGITLPIELLYFTGYDHGKVVDLYWATATETGNDFFTVERSYNGINFSDIAVIDAAGTSLQTIHYSHTDAEPLPGISYYRLRQTDLNGASSWSGIISVDRTVSGEQEIYVYPNPMNAGSSFVLNLSGFEGENVAVNVFDMTGRSVFGTSFLVRERYKSIEMNKGTELAPGTYLISVSSPKLFLSKNLIVR